MTVMNVNPETGEVEATGRSPRFTLWLAFLVFSTVTMGSAIGVKKADDDENSNAKWAVTCSVITFVLTAIIVLLHLSPLFSSYIVNTKVEGVICFVLACFWAGTVSVVSNASNGIAVDSQRDNTIVNGNLYYFSWAGFVTSVMLLVAYLRGVFGVDLAGEIQNRAARLTLWSGLLACQLVVMGASANIFDEACGGMNEDSYCRRTNYAIALGVIGTILSLIIVGMKMITSVAPFVVEGCLSLILCIMNGFGVAFITSAKGPGSPIGNLYYFTWLSFLCSFMLVASCLDDYKSVTAPVENTDEDGDVEVETIEDGGL